MCKIFGSHAYTIELSLPAIFPKYDKQNRLVGDLPFTFVAMMRTRVSSERLILSDSLQPDSAMEGREVISSSHANLGLPEWLFALIKIKPLNQCIAYTCMNKTCFSWVSNGDYFPVEMQRHPVNTLKRGVVPDDRCCFRRRFNFSHVEFKRPCSLHIRFGLQLQWF